MPRLIDDVSLARRFAAVGLAGFVLKSHYVPTAERAEVVRGVVPGVDVLGAVTLNGSIGGFNPVAVEIAGRQGAKIIWFPTVDSLNQRESRAEMPEGATPPMWAQLQDDLAAKGIMAPAIAVLDDNGGVLPEVRDVLGVIAAHDMVLATGHLSQREIVAVVDAGFDAGIRRIIVTHPEFTSQQLPVDVQQRLAGRGALLERCFTTRALRQGVVGGTVRPHSRGRPGALDLVERSWPTVQSAGRGRSGLAGRPTARRRLHR